MISCSGSLVHWFSRSRFTGDMRQTDGLRTKEPRNLGTKELSDAL